MNFVWSDKFREEESFLKANIGSATKEIPRIFFYKLKFHYRVRGVIIVNLLILKFS